MKFKITSEIDFTAYEKLVLSSPKSMIYVSVKFLKFLETLTKSQLVFFTLYSEHEAELLAAMPILNKNSKYGKVYNSLPFYGSNGSVIAKGDSEQLKLELLQNYFRHILTQEKLIGSTIINSPFESSPGIYSKVLLPNFYDQRISQITFLDKSPEKLFQEFHYKTRNIIRKAQKYDFKIVKECSDSAFDFLQKTHQENIASIGGVFKKKEFFDLVKSGFDFDKDYKIFVAYLNGSPVCALLNLYFNETVEYYTPVIQSDYREFQPLSLVIWTAMQDAIENGFKLWNWGGTWHSQKGVYDFKKRWATTELLYQYYINLIDNDFLNLTKSEILFNYEYFYTVPFDKLK